MDTKTKKIRDYVKHIPKPTIDEAKREELEKLQKKGEHQRSVDFKEYIKLSEKVKSMKDPLYNKKNHIPAQ